jgi:hypothetical protein
MFCTPLDEKPKVKKNDDPENCGVVGQWEQVSESESADFFKRNRVPSSESSDNQVQLGKRSEPEDEFKSLRKEVANDKIEFLQKRTFNDDTPSKLAPLKSGGLFKKRQKKDTFLPE